MSYERITNEDLARALTAHDGALRSNGLMPESAKLGLDHGSKTYGRAFRLFVTYTDDRPGWSGHHRPPVGDDFLGMTKRDAYEALTARTRHISDVFHVLQQADKPKPGAPDIVTGVSSECRHCGEGIYLVIDPISGVQDWGSALNGSGKAEDFGCDSSPDTDEEYVCGSHVPTDLYI